VGTAYGAPSNGLAIKFTPGSEGLQNLRYDYDYVGNIQTITDNLDGSRTQNFIYDELNRLTQAQSPAYGTISYQYNQIGNMTYNSQVGTYDYLTNPFKPHAVSRAGSSTYSYDANGNMTNKNGATIAYDYDNRPASIGANTFVYNHAGQRVKKNGTVYIGKLYECTGGSCTKYIFAGGSRIALKSGSTVNYYHKDHLGSSSIVTNTTGSKVEEIYYYPYGASRTDTGSVNVRHKYTGQERDGETGLYYYGARYYDPSIGRFISADSIVQAPGDPQTLNRYSYCRNNPIMYTDPSGHSFLGDLWDSIRDTFDPTRIYQNGGFMGLLQYMQEPLMHSFSYTYEGGMGTSGGYSYGGFNFGGGWQERGQNEGAFGYIGYGYNYGKFSVGGYFQHNTRGDYGLGVTAGYRDQRSSASFSIGYSFKSGGWSGNLMSMGVGVSYDTVTGKASMKIDYAEMYRLAAGYYTYSPERVTNEDIQLAYLDKDMYTIYLRNYSPEAIYRSVVEGFAEWRGGATEALSVAKDIGKGVKAIVDFAKDPSIPRPYIIINPDLIKVITPNAADAMPIP
jgi:RHS repeat-associated protein